VGETEWPASQLSTKVFKWVITRGRNTEHGDPRTSRLYCTISEFAWRNQLISRPRLKPGAFMLLDRDGTTGVGDGCRGLARQQSVAGGGEASGQGGGGGSVLP